MFLTLKIKQIYVTSTGLRLAWKSTYSMGQFWNISRHTYRYADLWLFSMIVLSDVEMKNMSS